MDSHFDRLSTLLSEFSGEGFWEWDARSNQVRLTAYCDELLGLPHSDQAKPREVWIGNMYPSDAYELVAAMDDALASGVRFREEVRLRTASETWLWVELRGNPLEDETGACRGFIGTLTDISARKDQEHALKSNQQRLQSLLQSMPDLVFVLDTAGCFVEFHPPVENSHLYPKAEDFVGQEYENLLPAEVSKGIGDAIVGVITEGKAQHVEIFLPGESGGRFLLATITALSGTEDWSDGFLCVARDVTEQKSYQKALAESETRFRHLFHHHHAPFLLVEADSGQIVDANRGAAEFYGYSPEELQQLNISAINQYSEEQIAQERLRAAKDQRNYFVFPHRLKGGEVRTVEVHSSPVEVNHKTLLFSIVHDITDRRRMEAELRVAATAFETQESMMVTDALGVVLKVNQAFTTLTGYAAEEIVHKRPAILKSGRQDAAFYEDMWHSLASTGHWQGEIWNKRKNGEIYPEWLSITAVQDEDGRITNYVGAATDITERKLAESQIRNLAFYDSLTQLANRRLLLDRLGKALANSHRSQEYGALIFLDLDHFKTLNDTQGHDVGDRLLIEVARRLSSSVRAGDTVARLGGDEFVVMLENLGTNGEESAALAEVVAEKIFNALNQPYSLREDAPADFHNTPSIGISLFQGQRESVDTLLKHADMALYQAKGAGRNTIRFYNPEMQAAVEARATMESGLRKAIKQGEFVLHYQPQIDRGRRVVGAEALLRWQHPEKGLVSPDKFIPVAEDTGQIVAIGQWVLETACQQLKDWSTDPLLSYLQLSINISARQFHQRNFVETVQNALDRHRIDRSRLKLELTESVVLDDVDDTIEKMKTLKRMGLGFAMDDFGTGYSSLSYLKRLPLEQLKIDRSFVMDIESDENDAAICAAIIALARNLGLKVVAEGVETDAQHYFLAVEHHCDLLQGYLFGKPVPVEEFVNKIRSSTKG